MLEAIRRAIRLFRLFGDVGIPVTIAVAAVELLSALMPAAVGAGLAGVVSAIEGASPGQLLPATLVPLVAFTCLLLLGYLADSLMAPLEYLAQSRIDGAHRSRLGAAVAACQTLDILELPDVQAGIRMVEADPRLGLDGTPGQGAVAQLRLLANRFGLLGALAILFSVVWYLPFIVLVPAMLLQKWRTGQTAKVAGLWQGSVGEELHADVWRQAAVSPGAAKEIRVFGLSRWSVDQMQHHIVAANRQLWDYIDHISRWHWVQWSLVLCGVAPAIWIVALASIRSGSVALLSATLAAVPAVFSLVESGGATHWIIKGASVLERFEQLLERLARSSRPRTSAKPTTGGLAPSLTFEDVFFSYPGQETKVLRSVNFSIGVGERVALVGINGAGKSTLVKLLAGFYQPSSGRIVVDGEDLSTLDLESWRARIAVILQDFVHYPLSLRDNVTSLHAMSEAAMDMVLDEAGLRRLAQRLPKGLETHLSTGRVDGTDLSGGQWQRVGLGRALAAVQRGAGLIVLDEPTAHLDVEAEAEVFQTLAATREKVSMLLISHRLSTVRGADRILVLDGGRIIEEGNHAQLMALGGRYAEMFSIQAARFRDDMNEQDPVHG